MHKKTGILGFNKGEEHLEDSLGHEESSNVYPEVLDLSLHERYQP